MANKTKLTFSRILDQDCKTWHDFSEIYYAVFPDIEEYYRSERRHDAVQKNYENTWAGHGGAMMSFCAHSGQNMVAFLNAWKSTQFNYGFIESIYVRPDYQRGFGVGSTLLKMLEQEMSKDRDFVVLYSLDDAKSFYKKFDYDFIASAQYLPGGVTKLYNSYKKLTVKTEMGRPNLFERTNARQYV